MKFNLNAENVNYIKISYRDKDNFVHCIKAAIRYINQIEILASAKTDEYSFISSPQTVELGIACDNGLYKAKTILQRVEYDSPYILFSLKRPEEMEFHQNREYFRVKIQENVNISYEIDDGTNLLSSVTYDLSAKGVRIELEKEVEFPDEVTLSLFFQNRIIEVKAKYIRTDIDDNIIKASFQFIDIKQPDLDFISQICFKKQLEERRKNLL